MQSRIILIDSLRGLALVMMFLFHFLWNLNYFNVTNFVLYSGPIGLFQKSIVSLFLLVAGFSLVLAFIRNGKDFLKKHLRRISILFLATLGITIFTFIFFQNLFIYFGIIHLILFSSIAGTLFVNKKLLSGVLGVILIIAPLIFPLGLINAGFFFWLGFGIPLPTLDFVPVIPWFGVFLIGMSLAQSKKLRKVLVFVSNKLPDQLDFLQVLGKHSLLFYLTHQFILVPLAFIVSLLL